MLVISESAGASVELSHATRTNPYDGQSLKYGLQNASVLDVTEKETPHAAAVSITELRRVSHNMKPEARIKFGLNEALENYCENIIQSGGCTGYNYRYVITI